MLTDDDLADRIVHSREWRVWQQYGHGRWWEVPGVVRSHLRKYSWLCEGFPLEFEKTVQRVARIIRIRSAKKAAKTRRKNDLKRRQGALQF